jgi:cytoskeletal protein CcmA (bactofilin family)
MRHITGMVENNLQVIVDTRLDGMIVGDVKVEAPAVFLLNGTVTGSVTVCAGARVEVRGMVGGDVLNVGGDLHVYGTIDGDLRRNGGRTHVDAGAVVGGHDRAAG